MRILFVSDLHYALKQFDWLLVNAGGYDLIIIGGDLLDLGSALDFEVQIVVVEKYLQRLRQKTPLLVSSGNHDGDARNAADESFARWLLQARADGLFVDGESALLEDTCITACPWWDGPVSRAELEALLVKEAVHKRRRWIWSHHAPPQGTLVSSAGKQELGDPFLREWIERFKPDLVLSGHLHNSPFRAGGSWIDRLAETWVLNPGRQPGAWPAHIALDLDAMTAEWVSIEGESLQRLTLSDR
jgi:Icc-related predicted phosphoesterase